MHCSRHDILRVEKEECLIKGGSMKKIAVVLAAAMLVLGLFFAVGYRHGTVTSQTSPQTTGTAPAETAPEATGDTFANREVGRWVTSNMIFLTTLINDTNKTLDYLANENLAYAEVACPQLRCDIATMLGLRPPVDTLASSRALKPAPSGYRCPPIPNAQAAANLNAGCAQLEMAINHLITGINTHNGDLIRGAEPEMQAASAYFAQVLVDLGNVE
jgi:hypothetical protein